MGWVENIARVRENAHYQHFLLFPNVFKRLLFQDCLKSGLCGKELRLMVVIEAGFIFTHCQPFFDDCYVEKQPETWGILIIEYWLNKLQEKLWQSVDEKMLDSSKLKKIADNNLNFHENGRQFFKQVEKTVGKGEIARFEQFLLFP